MEMPINRFKQRLKAGEKLVGLWSQFGNGAATEIVVDAGFDWILIDTEHAPLDLAVVTDQLRIIQPSASSAIVRPAWNDAVLFKRILDAGAQTLLVPYVESAQEARHAVNAARYPPRGRRGVATTHRANRYGRVSEYYARATDETCVLVQLETTQAVAVLEEIADVDGVDGVFIGPSDLAASMGYIGQPAHPEPRKLIADGCKRAKGVGIPIGILAPVEADAQMFLEMGFSFVAVGSEIGLLRKATDELRAKFR
jgi:2-keto-3-deoxy-L-rhamnonate aldolase RhmA